MVMRHKDKNKPRKRMLWLPSPPFKGRSLEAGFQEALVSLLAEAGTVGLEVGPAAWEPCVWSLSGVLKAEPL